MSKAAGGQAKREVIQDAGTSPQNCGWWVFFLEDWADSWAGFIGGSRTKVLWPTQIQPCCLPRTLDIGVTIWLSSQEPVAAWSRNLRER